MNKKIRVLLVDDEEQFVKNMARILKVRGFDVSTAFSGYDAVDKVKKEGLFDVVVLDVKMPGMDGIETLEKIKQWAPDTEVIMLTGHATLSSGVRAIRKGAYDYLMKPCEVEDLVEKVKEANETENIKRHPVLWPRKTVGEITLQALNRLLPEDPLIKAVEMMGPESLKGSVEQLYVLDRRDRLQGVVTKRDLIDEAKKAHPESPVSWSDLLKSPELLPEKTLSQIMKPQAVTVHPSEDLTAAAQQMITNKIRCMPVMSEGKAIGMIKLQDVFRYVEDEIK